MSTCICVEYMGLSVYMYECVCECVSVCTEGIWSSGEVSECLITAWRESPGSPMGCGGQMSHTGTIMSHMSEVQLPDASTSVRALASCSPITHTPRGGGWHSKAPRHWSHGCGLVFP